MNKILLIVDPQNDFLDDGLLPVPGSFDKMCALSAYLGKVPYETYDFVGVTLDWHPANHSSFATEGGPWPVHCVQYTNGALPFGPISYHLLDWQRKGKVEYFTKGEAVDVEEYAAFSKNPQTPGQTRNTLVGLRFIAPADANSIENTTIEVAGIVGTVCVQNTIQALIDLGYKNIVALKDYIAQFSDKDEEKFIAWCNKNNVTVK